MPRLVGPSREKETEHLFQLHVRGGLSPELVGAQHQELARASLGLLRELHHGVQAHVRRQVRGRLGVDLRPAGDRRGQLAADVLDLCEQVERRQIFGPLLERPRDLDLRVVQLPDLDQHSRVPDEILRRGERLLRDGFSRIARGHFSILERQGCDERQTPSRRRLRANRGSRLP